MTDHLTYVIIGANLAGGRAAETLRERGFSGRIVLAGGEPDRPYERPPLSKGFLQGKEPREQVFLRPPEYYDEQQIELRLGVHAASLLPAEHTVVFDDGARQQYEKLLIATGTQPRRLRLPGADLPGVHYLRTLQDAERLAEELARATRVAIIGAGFIGLEVAASARMLGRDVTVLEAAPAPLAQALGPDLGLLCAAIHRDRGVDLRLSCRIQELRGGERVEEVVLESGETIPCDLVVVGVGVTPSVDWLDGSGIALENGVLVNEFCETNLPDVYAAGDVANWWHPVLGERLRVEHYDNAQNHGVAVAASMLGDREPYAPVPYFWSDQYKFMLQYVGHARGSDRQVVRGDVDRRSFTSFFVRDDRLRAAFSIGRPRDIMAARRLIRNQTTVDPAALADEAYELRAPLR